MEKYKLLQNMIKISIYIYSDSPQLLMVFYLVFEEILLDFHPCLQLSIDTAINSGLSIDFFLELGFDFDFGSAQKFYWCFAFLLVL